MGQTKVELIGELASAPDLRTTPNGRTLLSFDIECGSGREPLTLRVTMVGNGCRECAAKLGRGLRVRVNGSLKQMARVSRAGIRSAELAVMADEIVPLDEP